MRPMSAIDFLPHYLPHRFDELFEIRMIRKRQCVVYSQVVFRRCAQRAVLSHRCFRDQCSQLPTLCAFRASSVLAFSCVMSLPLGQQTKIENPFIGCTRSPCHA